MNPEPQTGSTAEELRASAAIDAERDRQLTEEKWDEEHDDQHQDGSLWKAALFYVNTALKPQIWAYMNFKSWPWGPEWYKPWRKLSATAEIDKERCLIKAGALILAEQDRLDRALRKVITELAEVQTQNKTNE